MDKDSRIYVAGGNTLIGSAILRELERQRYTNIIGKTGDGPELTDAGQVDRFFESSKPDYVFLAAGKSGGIMANQKYPAEMMLENLLVECHVIHNAWRHKVKKLLYMASSCSYPKHCPQPMQVESILSGPLEPTSEAYAIAKIAGIKLCQAYHQQYRMNFIAGIPADVFGPGDNFNKEDSHVIPGLIRKMHEAKEQSSKSVEVWGSGRQRREFVFVDDLADAYIFVMNNYNGSQPINIGAGSDLSIKEVALLIKDIVDYEGELYFNIEKPDGIPVKVLDSGELSQMGWLPKMPLQTALSVTYDWFLKEELR